jgi:hypothetical protein
MDTATGAPPSLSVSGHALTVADSPPTSFAPSERSRTLRLDEFDDVPATRTAVPFGQPETPPPVEQGDHVPSRSSRKSGALVLGLTAVVAAAAVLVAFMVRRDSARAPLSAPAIHVEQSAESVPSVPIAQPEQSGVASPSATNSAEPAGTAASSGVSAVPAPAKSPAFAQSAVPATRREAVPARASATVPGVQRRNVPSSGLTPVPRPTLQKPSKKRDPAPAETLPGSGL